MTDEYIIRELNQMALSSVSKGFDPFAAALVLNNKIVATSRDQCIVYSDPTAHAELVLISEYCRANKLISLEGYSLYTNVEPCVMCSGAIHWARISRLIYGVGQSRLQEVSGGKPKPSCRDLINVGGKKIEVCGPILEDEGMKVLQQFPTKSKLIRHQAYRNSV